jgi:hypothetical protein
METTFQDIFNDLLASLIWFLLGIVLSSIYFYLIRKLPMKRLWQYKIRKPTIFLSITSLNPQKAAEYKRPTTGIGELEGVSFVRESLIAAYGNSVLIQLVFSNNFPETGLTGNIISIGGAKYNQTTQLFSKNLSLPINFVYDPKTYLIDSETSTEYYPEIDSDGIVTDFGLLIKIPNPYQKNKSVLLVRGAHTFGVAGAARLLTPTYSSELIQEIVQSREEYWQAVVETTVHGSQVFPKLVTFKTLTFDR